MGEEKLEFEAVARIDKDYAIGSCITFNGLFKINMNTYKCAYLQMFPNESLNARRLHAKAFLYKDKVIFVPCSANYISIYNLETEEIEQIEIKAVNIKKAPWFIKNNKFNDGVLNEDYLFIIGSTYPAVIRLDLKANQIEYFNHWVDGEFGFRKSPAVINDKFYIPSVKNNKVLCFDMKTCIGKIYHVGKHNKGSWGICKVNEELWMSPQEPGPVISWNPNNGSIKEYMDFPEKFNDGGFAFTKIYEIDDKVAMIPAYANMGVIVDIKTGKMNDSQAITKAMGEITAYMFDEGIYTYIRNVSEESSIHYRLNTVDNTMKKVIFSFVDHKKKYLHDYFDKQGIVKESQRINLQDFMEGIS